MLKSLLFGKALENIDLGFTMGQPNEITVFITTGDATCAECGEDLGRHAWIMLDKERRALCLACADLDDHDTLLAQGYDRGDARAEVERTVNRVLDKWQNVH